MKIAKYLPLLILLLFGPALSITYSFETDDFQVYMEIRETERAKPPYFLGKKLVLSYSADHPVRFVGAAFAHENFSRIHSFVKNENDIFMLIYPLPKNKGLKELRYRIVVDSLWMADPLNERTARDANGLKLSVISIPERFRRITTSPFVLSDGKVKFIYRGPENRNVYLTGDFNNWDPFMYKLQEEEKGVYEIDLRLTPGDHYYYYLSNGIRVLDPLNPDRGADPEGNLVSHFNYSPEEPLADLQE